MEFRKALAPTFLGSAALLSVVGAAMISSADDLYKIIAGIMFATAVIFAVLALLEVRRYGNTAECGKCGRRVPKIDLVVWHKDEGWCPKCRGVDGEPVVKTDDLQPSVEGEPPPEPLTEEVEK